MNQLNSTIKEFCGIFGISCKNFSYSVADFIYQGLMAIQHRGQMFSGIATSNCNGNVHSYKNFGLVSKVLNKKKLKTFSGNVGIGHVAYGSPKEMDLEDTQPYHFKSNYIEFALALNGTLINNEELRNQLKSLGRILIGNSDVEIIATLIETFSRFSETMLETLKLVMNEIKGAYSLVVLVGDGNLFVLRDPNGYKPLCYGKLELGENNEFFIISSESCAIDAIGGILISDINPGEIFQINPIFGIKKYEGKSYQGGGICQYEYVYFARPDSIIEGISVADVRFKLGRLLAKNDTFIDKENYIVVPVPDSGRSVAMGYAWESKIPYQEGLMKNRYLWQLKSDIYDRLNPIKSIVKEKNIILIDDSILSGITLKKILSMLRKAGAKSIHVRVGSPPIINTCDLNQSFSNRDLLIAYQKIKGNSKEYIEEIRKSLNADSLKFQSVKALLEAIGLDKNHVCFACLEKKLSEDKVVLTQNLKFIS